MEQLIIKRSEWGRGDTGGELWNPEDQCGCALGHYFLLHGAAKDDLAKNSLPLQFLKVSGLRLPFIAPPAWLSTITVTNDDPIFTEEDREDRLMHEFAQQDIALSFID
jgi:hypothetical protein